MKIFNFNHLEATEMSYFSHFKCALGIGTNMVLGGACCIVHSIFPFIFHNTATNIVKKIYFKYIYKEVKK
tara:strand:- start:462 stop:671 length:210 start_codon:yes stop_codon:yes gene_type:complete